MSEKNPQARVLGKTRLLDDFFKVDKYKIDLDRHGGGTMKVERLVLERGHAVAMLGYDPVRDQVLMVNEMRPGMLAAGEYPFRDATPAGIIDKGETPLQAARREMFEETGMRLKHAKLIHPGAYVSAGGSSERLSLVVGIVDMRKAGGVHGHETEGESIKTVIVSSKEFFRRAQKGEVKDMKSLVFAFWLAINKRDLQKKYGAKPTRAASRAIGKLKKR